MCKDRVAYRERFRAIFISVSQLQQDILELTDQSQVDFQPVQFIY
jgi:hypothetical protein